MTAKTLGRSPDTTRNPTRPRVLSIGGHDDEGSDLDFVIGHPRSGTTFVAKLLNAGGARHCRHEYLAALSSMCVPIPTEYYRGKVGREEVYRLLAHYDFTPTPWVRIDSNWKLVWILPVLLERFPDARVVHLTRDPRTNVRSCSNLGFYGTLHHRPEFLGRRFWLSWMPDVDRPDWDELSAFERNCAFWAETHRLAMAGLAKHPHTHRVRLEDLTDRRAREELFDFLGLPQPPRRAVAAVVRTPVNRKVDIKAALAAHGQHVLPEHDRWPAPLQGRLVQLCGATATELGYQI